MHLSTYFTVPVAFAASALMGCSPMNDMVRRQGALDLNCPADQLEITVHSSDYRVSGCGMQVLYTCWHELLGSTRCYLADAEADLPVLGREPRVQAKASELLACPLEAVEVQHAGSDRYAAEGCGRHIDYECRSRSSDCCAFIRPGVITVGAARAERARGAPVAQDGQDAPSKETIVSVLSRASPAIRACYMRTLTDPPPFKTGILDIRFEIAGGGRIISIGVHRASMDHPELEDCVLNALRPLSFPRPGSRQTIVVVYPYLFLTAPPYASCN